jgi:hypothetical protein
MPVQGRVQVRAAAIRREPVPWWRAELPFGILLVVALASPFCVLDQGGTLRSAVFAALVVLAVPGAAVESMVGAVRLALMLCDRR